MNKKPIALELAEKLESKWWRWKDDPTDELKAAEELRRLLAANLDCIAWYEAAIRERNYLLTVMEEISDDCSLSSMEHQSMADTAIKNVKDGLL